MAKKKLLNEAQVRRFMSLSGIKPLKEMYSKTMEEDEVNEAYMSEEDIEEKMNEEDEVKEAYMSEDEMSEEMYGKKMEEEEEPAEAEEAEEEVTLTQDTIDNFGQAAMELLDQLGFDKAAPAMDAEEPEIADEPAMDVAGEEEPADEKEAEEDQEVMEALSGVNIELNEDELVQEVAKRVAKRILKAKKAKQQLDEALGKKKA